MRKVQKGEKWDPHELSKVILLHDSATAYKTKLVRETFEALRWEVLTHTTYSPDLAPSYYHLFRLKRYKNASMNGFSSKPLEFFAEASANCQRGGVNVCEL